MKLTIERLNYLAKRCHAEGKEVPRWILNELKYARVTLRDRIPGPENKNDSERRIIKRDYEGV